MCVFGCISIVCIRNSGRVVISARIWERLINFLDVHYLSIVTPDYTWVVNCFIIGIWRSHWWAHWVYKSCCILVSRIDIDVVLVDRLTLIKSHGISHWGKPVVATSASVLGILDIIVVILIERTSLFERFYFWTSIRWSVVHVVPLLSVLHRNLWHVYCDRIIIFMWLFKIFRVQRGHVVNIWL